MHTFIDWHKLEFKKQGGTEKIRCPKCDEQRTDKKDKSLVINHNEGFGKCMYCEALTFKESNKVINDKVYKLPTQDWHNYTSISDNWVKLIEGRKISQIAIRDLGVTEEMYYQPKRKKEVTNLVFNYFEGSQIVNKKYRDSGKAFTQSVGTKSIFYNINSVISEKECYIVEGEFDVLAMHTHGIRNCISVPNGANDNDEYWVNSEPYLKDIEKFIIAVDNDDKGNALKEKIAQRLGRYRCTFIEFVNKDANGDLIAGILGESISKAKRFPVSGTFTVSDMKQEMVDLWLHGLPDTIFPKHACWGELSSSDIFSVMRGHLVTATGIPSHGKSEFIEWYATCLVNDYDMKMSVFSPEHQPLALHQTRFVEKAVGRPYFSDVNGTPRITLEDLDRYEDWANEKIYLTSPDNGEVATSEWLMAKFKEHIFAYGTDIFIIDAFNKVRLPRGNKLDEINDFLTELTTFAQVHNVIIFLVAHPTKMKAKEDGTYEQPSLYNVAGSSDFRNQTHDGLCIYRYFRNEEHSGYVDFTNLKTKMKFQGKIGERVSFEFDEANGRYYPRGGAKSTFDMTRPAQELQITNNSDILPAEIDEEEMPF